MGNYLGSEVLARSQTRSRDRDKVLAAEFLAEADFVRSLRLEMRRSERSKKPFVLVLLRAFDDSLIRSEIDGQEGTSSKVHAALIPSTRETDIKGWFQEGRSIGVIFTEVIAGEANEIGKLLLERVQKILSFTLTVEQMEQLRLTMQVYPQPWDSNGSGNASEEFLQALLEPPPARNRGAQAIKRTIDVMCSLLLLALISPVFLFIALLVKLTSRGPVLFRQVRVGMRGQPFTFLKFRSMAVANDHSIHQEYVKNLIAGTAAKEVSHKGEGVYKLTKDPRVTPLGKFLRRSSLDELPQLINVLKGDMSLVGPRPPIPYEVKCYERWHLRRLSAAKPGITGLWQVNGRSRTTFDDMVRMDIRYGKAWSLGLDLKILLKTPLAVMKGNGAH